MTPKHAIAHNKIILLDDATIITGSFNFSDAAEKSNAENLLIIENKPALAAAYLKNFADHEAHCVAYVPPSDKGTVEKEPTAAKPREPVVARP